MLVCDPLCKIVKIRPKQNSSHNTPSAPLSLQEPPICCVVFLRLVLLNVFTKDLLQLLRSYRSSRVYKFGIYGIDCYVIRVGQNSPLAKRKGTVGKREEGID